MSSDDELIEAMLVAMYDDGRPGAVDSMRAVLAIVREHDKRMPIDSDELQSAAEAFAEWSDGAAYFKYHAFARWVEQRHGILEREAWEVARDR